MINIIKVIQYIRETNITKDKFCELCNIKSQLLDDIIYYGKRIDFKIAEKIAEVIEIGVYELY